MVSVAAVDALLVAPLIWHFTQQTSNECLLEGTEKASVERFTSVKTSLVALSDQHDD